MANFDFRSARVKHESWKARLLFYLDGRMQVCFSEAVSPRDCALGKWLYSEGLAKYGQLSEVKALESEHARMHALMKSVLELKRAGRTAEARREFESVSTISDGIVRLLTDLDKKNAVK